LRNSLWGPLDDSLSISLGISLRESFNDELR
jgi:hypothetical protein